MTLQTNIRTLAQPIRLLISDVDGIFSDGRIYLGNQGEELKTFHTRDGHGVKSLMHFNIPVAIITGRESALVERRMKALGIEDIYQGRSDKRAAYEAIKQKYQLTDQQIAYIGDDLPDLPLIKRAGLGITVQDAHPFVKQHADWITTLSGGHGALREVCDVILDSQDLLDDYHQQFLQ